MHEIRLRCFHLTLLVSNTGVFVIVKLFFVKFCKAGLWKSADGVAGMCWRPQCVSGLKCVVVGGEVMVPRSCSVYLYGCAVDL